MVRSARLDGRVFRSLREDTSANRQSILVLGLGGLCFSVGLAFSVGADPASILVSALIGVVASILLGFLWLTLTFLIGTRLLGGTSTYWGLARPLFFSVSPAPLFLLMLIPVSTVPDIARAIGLLWIAVSSVFAVKNGLGVDAQKSLIIFIVSSLVIILLYAVLISLFLF